MAFGADGVETAWRTSGSLDDLAGLQAARADTQTLDTAIDHRADALELYAIDASLIAALAARLDRRMAFTMTVGDRELFLSLGSETLSGKVSRAPAL